MGQKIGPPPNGLPSNIVFTSTYVHVLVVVCLKHAYHLRLKSLAKSWLLQGRGCALKNHGFDSEQFCSCFAHMVCFLRLSALGL